ncbi:hypothetical protein BJ912DRAFT_1058843 [Pholiota molesta]|nr:hypothetical protein BJ912DRAFT_1058843 [Pholiota molesta]
MVDSSNTRATCSTSSDTAKPSVAEHFIDGPPFRRMLRKLALRGQSARIQAYGVVQPLFYNYTRNCGEETGIVLQKRIERRAEGGMGARAAHKAM